MKDECRACTAAVGQSCSYAKARLPERATPRKSRLISPKSAIGSQTQSDCGSIRRAACKSVGTIASASRSASDLPSLYPVSTMITRQPAARAASASFSESPMTVASAAATPRAGMHAASAKRAVSFVRVVAAHDCRKRRFQFRALEQLQCERARLVGHASKRDCLLLQVFQRLLNAGIHLDSLPLTRHNND